MGSKRSATAYAPGANQLLRRLLVSLQLAGLFSMLWAPVARADWETVYCVTSAKSLDVATANSSIQAYRYCLGNTDNCSDVCCQTNAFDSHCTTFWTAGPYNFYMCGSTVCNECGWITDMWLKVLDTCTQNIGGVDRVAGYVAYNWSPGIWTKYGF